jgi:putative nucleotidyltransferase with HDIG domain
MNEMNCILPEKLNSLANACKFPLYVVGGTCRDFLAGFSSTEKDYDICAPVSAEKFIEAATLQGFKVVSVYKATGTVKLTCDGVGYEFTSFRSDEYVRGKHSPERVYFTDDILKDALRRDFKCNAVYYDIVNGAFVDPLGGIEDINKKLITCVAPAKKVFGEDGLRLMRLCRQSAQLGFSPDDECLDGAKSNCALIADISPERVWGELKQLLTADKKYGVEYAQYNGLRLLKEVGVLAIILPEVAKGEGIIQRSDYHNYDVLEHSLRCVKYADESVRLAALLHDVGKSECFISTGKFCNHENVGAVMADKICERLRVSKKLKEITVRLVRSHMYDMDCLTKEGKIRKFIVQNGDIYDQLLAIKQADFSACKDDLSQAPCVEKWQRIYKKMQDEGAPFSLKDLKVNGLTLIAEGIPPAHVGKTLNFLLLQCACTPALNDSEKLKKLAHGYLKDRVK